MFNPSLVTFFIFIIFRVLLTCSSSSWLIAWVRIELNTLCFIPIMLNFKSGREGESAVKYFLTQTLASIILLVGALGIKALSFSVFSIFVRVALLIKLGAAPFHRWIITVGENLNWLALYLILTVQKINPFILLLSRERIWNVLVVRIAMSAIVGGIAGLSQTNLRKLLIFSSINHLGWLLTAARSRIALFRTYFWIYCLLLLPIIYLSIKMGVNYLRQISSLPLHSTIFLLFIISLLSLGGLPPFLGFFPKWLVIYDFILSGNFILGIILIFMRLYTLYYYLRITFSSFILRKFTTEPRWLQAIPSLVTTVALRSSILGFLLIFLC